MARLDVRLLGEPSIQWDGHPWEIARRQARALLFRLAADTSPVPRSQLTFLFWPDAPDTTSRRNLTQRLSLLRRDLPDPSLLQTTATHVHLDREQVCVDVARFRQLLSETGARQVASLVEAVDLYSDSFLVGFSLPNAPEFDQWVHAQRSDLQGLLLDALADLVNHHAETGNIPAAVAAARHALSIDPLDEAMHRRLIRLYTAAGDRAAALQQFETCAAILERELGVDPLPDTVAAYQAALAGSVDAPEPPAQRLAWKTQPSLHVPFTGREDALADLARAYRRAQSGQGGVVLITGEAGMGKTRLVQEFAGRLPDNGLVLVGSSQRESLAAPYGSPVEALRSGLEQAAHTLADGGRRARLADLLPGGVAPIWLSEASRLLPELRALAPNLPQPIEIRDPDAARTRLFEALHRLLAALPALRQTTLLFLDDLHWADEATVGWLSYLSGKLRRSRLLMVAALRPGDVAGLDDLRATLSRRQALHEMALAGWDRATVQQVLERLPRLTGEDAAGMAVRLHNTTGGNPFFVLSILQEMVEGGSEKGDDKLPVPGQVREVLERRVQGLQPAARQVLEAGAVLGARHDFALLQAISGRDGLETADGLDELVARQMLDPLPAGFQFHHDLIRATAYDRMSSWRRRLLHSRAADALEERLAAVKAGTKPGVDEIEFQEIDLVRLLAEQHIEAAQEERAVSYLFQAGQYADSAYANEEAVNYFNRALAFVSDDDRETQWELLNALEIVNQRLGDWEIARSNADQMLPLAEALQDSGKISIVLQRLAFWYELTGSYEEAERAIQGSIVNAQDANDVLLEARARGLWGKILWRQDRIDAGVEQRQQQLALAHQLSDRQFEALALFQLGSVIGATGDGVQAEQLTKQALALTEEIGDRFQTISMYEQLVVWAFSRGDYDVTERLLEKTESLTLEFGVGTNKWFVQDFRAGVAEVKGDLVRAEKLYRLALSELRKLGIQAMIGITLADIGYLQAKQGRFKESLDLLGQSATVLESISAKQQTPLVTEARYAACLMMMGDTTAALERIEPVLEFLARDQRLYFEHALEIPAICIQVLAANSDARLDSLVAKQHARMQKIANSFNDAEQRRMFLENVPWHREITAAWEALQDRKSQQYRRTSIYDEPSEAIAFR